MSGIAGLFHLDRRPLAPGGLERMVGRLAHRGPERHGTWRACSIGLGYRDLATAPDSPRPPFPPADHPGVLALVADARIDNRAELLATLQCRDRSDTSPDSSLILAAYERWGESCPERLLGDFAFAIWDGRNETLFCARDHLGVRPFYYSCHPRRLFAFASEIKALLCVADIPRRLDEESIGDFLAGIHHDATRTTYHAISRLPAGHSVMVSPEGVRLRAYWAPAPACDARFRSGAEEAEAFRALFADAVRCRLRSASPVAATLSGGLDSSSVACTARDLLNGEGRHLITFSGRGKDRAICPESPYIDAVLRGPGMVPRTVHPGQVAASGPDPEHDIWARDEPVDALTPLLLRAVLRAVKQQDIRVLLDGVDGDLATSVSLDSYLSALLRQRRWRTLAREVTDVARVQDGSPWRVLLKCGAGPLLRGAPRASQVRRQIRARWIDPEFARRTHLRERLAASWAMMTTGSLREMQLRRLTSGTVPMVLELLDRAAAAQSIELRHPFLDRRIVEFCLALPPGDLVRGGWSKRIVRDAMAGVVPEEVRWRADRASVNVHFTLAFLEQARRSIERVLTSGLDVVQAWVDVRSLRRHISRIGAPHAFRGILEWWEIAALAEWCRRVQMESSGLIR